MADIKFACPLCGQNITCDELWAGHELQCPSCQGNLAVPPMPAPAATAANPLVPRPPHGGAARLSLNQPKAPDAAAGGSAPGRNIPIRNLAPAVAKKQNP